MTPSWSLRSRQGTATSARPCAMASIAAPMPPSGRIARTTENQMTAPTSARTTSALMMPARVRSATVAATSAAGTPTKSRPTCRPAASRIGS